RSREYRFVVPGRAISFRSPLASAYKTRIAEISSEVISSPIAVPVEVRIDYFHSRRRRVDVDNVTKAVLDGMNGIAYLDDRLATYAHTRAHRLDDVLFLPEGPIDLIKPLASFSEYVL